ncbi:MAG: type IX secretion system outer membrane channel protein PorV [Balneolaceae bacterium]
MRKFVFLLTAFALTFGLAQISTAQVGITAVPFLQIEPDSRGAGMGNTGVAIADNASAIFWNPAGLAFQDQTQISITHANWLPAFNADLFYDYLVGVRHFEGIGTLGAHITFLNLGEQVRTSSSNIELGRFNSFEIAGGVSYGFNLNDNWALGTGLRFIYSSLADGNVGQGEQQINPGSSVGVDLAAMYKSNPFLLGNRNARFNAGMNLSNLGPSVQYIDNEQKDPLPTVLRAGWALTMDLDSRGVNTLTLANDISKLMARNEVRETDTGVEVTGMNSLEALFRAWGSFERTIGDEVVTVSLFDQLMIGTGLEYWYNQQFALRGGFYHEAENNGNRRFVTLGAGLRYNLIGVDFSYIYTLEEDHPLANTIRLSLLLTFN